MTSKDMDADDVEFKPIPYGIGILISKQVLEDEVNWWECIKRWQQAEEQREKDRLVLSPEEFEKKYPPPPPPAEAEFCECCGQELDDYA